MQKFLLILFLFYIPSALFPKNLNYLLDIKYRDFPKLSKERIVLYFTSPPLFYNISSDNNTLKITLDNTDLKNFYGNLKIPSFIIDTISVKQLKNNLSVKITFKNRILDYSEIKSEKPPLLYIKVTTTPVKIAPAKPAKSVDNTTGKPTVKGKKITKPKTSLKPTKKRKKKPVIKRKPRPKVKEIVTKAQIDKARNYYEQGLAYMSERKFAEAIAVFQNLISSTKKTNPYHIKAEFRIADCYYFTVNKEKSNEIMAIQKMYRQLLAKYPKSTEAAWAAFQMANCYKLLGFFEEAAGTYKFVTKYYPKSVYAPKAFLELSTIYYNMKKYKSALENFRKILINYSDSIIAIQANYYIANSLYHLDRFDEAYKVFMEALKRNKKFLFTDPETLYNIGNTYYHRKDYLKSREYFLKLRTLFPKTQYFDLALLKIGESYIQTKEYPPAIYVFKRVIDVSKSKDNIIIARMELAAIGTKNIKDKELLKKYYNLLNPEKAYNYIIKNYPKHKLTQIAFARIINYYLDKKNYASAINYIEKFFQRFPGSQIKDSIKKKIKPTLIGYFNNLFTEKKYDTIVTYFEKYEKLMSRKISPVDTFKKVYISYKKLYLIEKAQSLLVKLLKKLPRNQELLYERLSNYILNKQYGKAFKNISKITNPIGKIKFLKGECYENFTNFKKALNIYFELLKNNFKNKGLLNYRIAETYRKSGDFKKAYGFYDYITANFNKSNINNELLKDAYFKKAHMKYLLQNFKDAVKEFKDFINLYPDDSKTDSAYYYTVKSLYYEKDYENAINFYELIKPKFKDKNILTITNNLVDEIKWIKTLSL